MMGRETANIEALRTQLTAKDKKIQALFLFNNERLNLSDRKKDMSTQSSDFTNMLDCLVKVEPFESVDDYEDAVEALTHRPVDQPFYFEDPVQVKSALARWAF